MGLEDIETQISEAERIEANARKALHEMIIAALSGKSMTNLAEELGVSRQYLYLIKNGENTKKQEIKTRTLLEIAKKCSIRNNM